ncbi:hypothetical protein MMYC01_206719 [Madurella mycetomatis]|uniref:TLC domain-containing protein n=1 Tax=Madurella mycetomatis TaxID=100816 RepID=A0A175VZT9_9PEZI|nr:hypothetical protein MMYC01_206719 [Madurella mycetomatis]
MAVQSLIYLSLWLTTSLVVRRRGPSTTVAPTFTKYNSRLYSLASFLLLLLLLSPYPHHDTPARTLFHLSKFYEYVDVLGVTAGGGAVDLHFAFHHLTTPWLTFVRVLPGCEGWRWFGAANVGHHALMYAYFGGWEGVRSVVLWTGQAQLGIGIAADGWAVWERLARGEGAEGVWRFLVSGGLLGLYWVLSVREMRARATARGKEEGKGE